MEVNKKYSVWMWAPVQGVCLTKRAVTNLTCIYCIVTFQPTSYKYLFSGSRPLNGHSYKNKIQIFTWGLLIQPNLSCFQNDTDVQYTRPESGCLHQQADWVRLRPEPEMGARRLISGTGSKRLTGKRGVEDVGKRTRSDPMETVRPGKRRSDSPEVSSRETEKISPVQPWGETNALQWNIRRF